MLSVKNVSKEFDNLKAVDDISFNIEDGKVLGIVGRNGAGKSTLFRMILGLIPPTIGKITYNDSQITQETLNHFGFLPEEGSLLPQHTVLDICEYYGSLKLMKKDEIVERLTSYLEKFNIESYLNKKANTLSKGNRQKIQFIVSILHNPDFIILDEPFSGLDPVSVEELENAILELKKAGKTIIFSSHIMNHVEKLCDDVLIIDHGKSLLYGSLNDILNSYTINGQKASSLNDIFIDKVGEENE